MSKGFVVEIYQTNGKVRKFTQVNYCGQFRRADYVSLDKIVVVHNYLAIYCRNKREYLLPIETIESYNCRVSR